MGYWSEHIMGGDTPSEISDEILDMFPSSKGYSPDTFMKYLNKLLDTEEQMCAVYVIVADGNLPINDTIRQIGLKAAQQQYEEADSFDDSAARRQYVQQFINVLKQYPDEGMTVNLDPD